MTTFVNYYRIASHCYSSNTCDVGGSLFPAVPMRMVLASSATPELPISILLSPVVRIETGAIA